MRPVTRRRLRSALPCADYAVPDYFRDDLYDTTAKIRAQFPLYRYFVVGGPRTGSTMHTDPHFTAAWNGAPPAPPSG